jgi:monoterpene epsilon-lactone hydrolase
MSKQGIVHAGRALIFAGAATVLGIVVSLSPAFALDEASQTKQSEQQVANLIALWNKYYLNEEGIAARRAAFARFMAKTPQPTRVQIKHVDADGVDADLIWPARLHHPVGKRAILLIHGGGFYSGSLRTHRVLAASLAKAASAEVLLIDYRLSPESQFPAQIDDALNAYRWLLAQGYRNDNVIISGDAAGGNIAIETTLRQMQVKEPLPAAVIVMSPLTDLAATGTSMNSDNNSDPLIGKAEIETIRNAYLGYHSPTEPEVSPLYADLSGFPPLLMQVGSREALKDDTLRLADNARKKGVDVSVEVWPGMIHEWQLFPFLLDDARRANQHIADYAIKHFADKPEE